MTERIRAMSTRLWRTAALALVGVGLGSALAPQRVEADYCEMQICVPGVFYDSCEDTSHEWGCRDTGVLSCSGYPCDPGIPN